MDSYGKPPGTVLSPPQGDAGSPSPTDLLSRQPLQEQAWAGADRATLQLIARLFPSPTLGQTFVARFVERAAKERSSIPGLRTGDVIICTKSIAELAEELDIAYDTAQKYVVLFQALGLLQKRKFMERIAFVLSLGIYHPPTALEANLEYLLQRSQTKKSRSKLHELVKDVKQRCLVYGLIDQEWTAALQQLHQLVQSPVAGTSRSKLEQRLAQAQHLVSRMLARAMTERLPRGETFFANLPGSPDAADKTHSNGHSQKGESTRQESTKHGTDGARQPNLPGVSGLRDAEPQRQGSESSQDGRPGRFVEASSVSNLPGLPAQVDFPQRDQPTESTQTGEQGRRSGRHVAPNPPSSLGQVDSPQRGRGRKSASPAHPGRFTASDSSQNLSKKDAQVDSEDFAHVNVDVITLINNITSNVRLVAAFCCHALDEPSSKLPIYLKLFRECSYDAQAVSAALLFTIVHRRDGTIRNPASVFMTRCRDYHAQGVSEEAAVFVRQYGLLTYSQLLDALSKPASFTPSARAAPSPARIFPPPSTPASTASLSPLPRWGTIQRFIAIEDDRPGMSREEALRVIGLARGDRRTKMCRVDLERLADGSYAVLLDNTITHVPRQTYFYSEQDWAARTVGIQECFELFGGTRSGRRCLADALKERRAKP